MQYIIKLILIINTRYHGTFYFWECTLIDRREAGVTKLPVSQHDNQCQWHIKFFLPTIKCEI